jgi:hypothetical protein
MQEIGSTQLPNEGFTVRLPFLSTSVQGTGLMVLATA